MDGRKIQAICDAILTMLEYSMMLFFQVLNAENAALWLDLRKKRIMAHLSYGAGARNYGHIWGNREVQPEMWEMKKGTTHSVTLMLKPVW